MLANAFTSIFVEEFKARAALDGAAFAPLWHAGGPTWTRVMVHSENKNSVLEKTLVRWADQTLGPNMISLHRWYTIDLMAVSPAFDQKMEYWYTRPVALVEHENRKDIETELWKLAHWRAPLKVLAFYQFGEKWLDEKLTTARRIVEGAQSSCPETDAEYLLLVGCNNRDGVTWRAESWQCGSTGWTSSSHATGVLIG
ncbi:hypothetical protein [Terricaulis sp.]|uniref:hypothetical protein n=1 Tax=Terricaulis sp. TaxID=2768686 RepID=UPI002AC7D1CC|nr:hypothetical protein [Terricaulis sp.]MDZ4690207.1 hypothetical protein [Terricaulis sp.]